VQWLAPEVIAGRGEYDHRSDIYSFAIVCWEIASRSVSLPFQEYEEDPEYRRVVNLGEVLLAANKRPSMPEASEACPEAFAHLIQECWAYVPTSRPEFPIIVQQLEQMLGIESDSAPSTSSQSSDIAKRSQRIRGSAANKRVLSPLRFDADTSVITVRVDEEPPQPSLPLELDEWRGDGNLFSLRSTFSTPRHSAVLCMIVVVPRAMHGKNNDNQKVYLIWVGLQSGEIVVYHARV
jgi:serine/threonine protein kinase